MLDKDPVLAKNRIRALYLKRWEIFKSLLNEYFRKFLKSSLLFSGPNFTGSGRCLNLGHLWYVWHQKYETKMRLLNYLKNSLNRLLKIYLRLRYRAPDPILAKTGSSSLCKSGYFLSLGPLFSRSMLVRLPVSLSLRLCVSYCVPFCLCVCLKVCLSVAVLWKVCPCLCKHI